MRAAKRRDARLVTQAKEIYETENQDALLSRALGAPPLDAEALTCGVPHGTSCKTSGETPHHESCSVTAPDKALAPRTDEHRVPHGTSHSHLRSEQPTHQHQHPHTHPAGQPTPASGKQAIAAAMTAAKAEPKGENWQNPRLRFNPKARSATPAQRREILRRDGYCCSTPGCPNRHWLQLHHLVAVSCGGETAPSNLIALCSRCHKNYHDGHLLIEVTADGECIFKNTQGHDLARETRIEVAGWINFWLGWEGEAQDCYIRRWAMAA